MNNPNCLRPAHPARTAVAACLLLAAGGCAEWSATPARLEANYGASVRNMVLNQTANPDKARHPAPQAPDGADGVKAQGVLEQAYRQDVGNPGAVRRHDSAFGFAGEQGSPAR